MTLFPVDMDYSILDRPIESNLPFAIYKLPDKEEVHLILQNDNNVRTIHDVESICNQEGFVICPFVNSKQTPIISIRPDFHLVGTNEIINFPTNFFRNDITFNKSEYYKLDAVDDFEIYKTNFEVFHKALTNKRFAKLVLSREMIIRKKTDFSIGKIFERAIEKYPNTFIYLLNTSKTGVWFGCSPEALLSGKNKTWKTAALAGTRKTAPGKIDWDYKNIAEQKIVADFIKENLENLQIAFKKGEPYTVQAGNIEHCNVDFTITLDSPEKAGILLKALHPTPAVSGYPKDEAIKFITENENYERLYYSGFAGAVNISDATDLFVNIRCMQVSDNKLRLYAGGGLTESSELNDEWLETEYKLQTLLALFEMQHVTSLPLNH
ncbi:MAG: isochorismate synthase [Tannerella sp.]|jgi:isochorismate synthase|nr:isochorismate synthase [Tannerella sp.]